MSSIAYPEKIIGSKFEINKCYYLVKWKRCKNPTWEPAENISHREDLIAEYRDMIMLENISLKNRGYIYCRVSSKKQSNYNEGHTSLEVQEETIRKYCIDNDIDVIQCIREVYSARNMDFMSGLLHIVNIASRGQTIYVYDISRFSRNAHHALNILDELYTKGVNVHSVTENISYGNAVERNQFRLQLCAANYMSDICSQKVKASIQFRRSRGDYIGGTPYGFSTMVDENNHIRKKVINKSEMKIIELIRKRKDDDPKDILKTLVEMNIKFRNREPTISGIKRIINRFSTDLYDKRRKVRNCNLRVNKPY